MDAQAKLLRYEELKQMISDAEAELDQLKPEIVALIPAGKEVETERGVFVVQSRSTWKFSKNHTKAKSELKELEEEEKAKGIATAVQSSVLYYKPKVEQDEA